MPLNSRFFSFFIGLMLVATHALAQSTEVQFSTDELPSESVTPILDFPQAVQNRSLVFSKRFDFTPLFGWMLDEPFYQKEFGGLLVNYSLDEVNTVGFRFQSWVGGISDYGKQFEASSANLRFDWVSGPKTAAMFNYERKFMYGKISLAKGTVFPMVVYGIGQVGAIAYGSRNLPMLGIGIGQKFFFAKSWGLQLQLQQWMHQALDPLSANIRGDTPPQTPEGRFTNKLEPSTFLDLGLVYLL